MSEFDQDAAGMMVPADSGPGAMDLFAAGQMLQAAQDAGGQDDTRIVFCSYASESREDRIRAFNAISAKVEPLSDHLGATFQLAHVIAHTIRMDSTDPTTGEVRPQTFVRTVLEDSAGNLYGCVSTGILASLRKLFGLIGFPPYDPPLSIIIKQYSTRKGYKVLGFEIGGEEPSSGSAAGARK